MGKQVFGVEQGIGIFDDNTLQGIHIIQGAGAPGGDTGYQDAAPIGSFYLDRTNAIKYQKTANAGAAADWVLEGQLSSGLDTATNGAVAAGDSFEEAIGKIYANLEDLISSVGIAQGDADLGAFTGNILTDNSTVKALLQELSDYIEANLVEDASLDGVTTSQVIDDEIVDEVLMVEYLVVISLNDDNSNRVSFRLTMFHDGSTSADATDVDEDVSSIKRFGPNFNYSLTTEVNGTGAAQVMRFSIASTETNGVDVRARKVGLVRQ